MAPWTRFWLWTCLTRRKNSCAAFLAKTEWPPCVVAGAAYRRSNRRVCPLPRPRRRARLVTEFQGAGRRKRFCEGYGAPGAVRDRAKTRRMRRRREQMNFFKVNLL
ncbi:hypothetical protein KL86DES1_20170 [uncultured Desulfovibrio sp.]|uniref:Uncharacterized protein n=1 Tax=uncultured Desulfovibrio sp. TaxID=167968 RepID=A0A212L2G1_9BACT|nr:hypothetical protein KL86DES1_20170 [uncultured Desulfovibrio sp.]VZH33069.1 conserved protein of unknown function [Desulfovibrio sp. 86]